MMRCWPCRGVCDGAAITALTDELLEEIQTAIGEQL